MSMPTKLFYNGFESKRKAITFAIQALREKNLVTPAAEFFYEDYAWSGYPKDDKEKESFDFSTWTSDDDEIYYRVTASIDDYGWKIVIKTKYIPTPDPEMGWYDDSFYGHYY